MTRYEKNVKSHAELPQNQSVLGKLYNQVKELM